MSGAWLFVRPKELHGAVLPGGEGLYTPVGNTLLFCTKLGLPALSSPSACPDRSYKMGWPQW